MSDYKNGAFSHIKALNMLAPSGSVENVSSGAGPALKTIADGDQVKRIWCPASTTIVIVDEYGNTGTFTGFGPGWLDIPVKEITSSSNDVVINYME